MKTVAMNSEIRQAVLAAKHWADGAPAGYAAKPYADALASLPDGATRYYEDEVKYLLVYLVQNLGQWKGETAREAKKTLRAAK